MSDPVIKGATYLVGFPTGETVSGVVRDTYDKQPTADIEWMRNENNAEDAALVSNPGMRIVIDGKCSADQSGLVKGGTLTLNSVVYLIEDVVVKHSPAVTRFSATVYKPDAATLS